MGDRDKNYQFTRSSPISQPGVPNSFGRQDEYLPQQGGRKKMTPENCPLPSMHEGTKSNLKLKESNSQLFATLLNYETLTSFSLKADLVASNQDFLLLI